MKKIIIILFISSFYFTVFGQNNPYPKCEEKENTTDPNNPIDEYRGPNEHTNLGLNRWQGQPRFDWMALSHWWTKANNAGDCEIATPFLQSTYNDNLLHVLGDFHELEDGWELITYQYGMSRTGVVSTNHDINHPYFVVYNKYSGILRAFVRFTVGNLNETPRVVTMTLEWNDLYDRPNESFNTNLASEAGKPLDLYEKHMETSVANIIYNGFPQGDNCAGMWLSADFVMAYDPCVCRNQYKPFSIRVHTISTANIELTGTISGNFADQQSQGNGNTMNTSGSTKVAGKSTLDQVNSGIKESHTTMKGATELYSKLSSAKSKLPPVIDSITNEVGKQAFDLAKAIPYVGTAIGLVNFLIKVSSADKSKEQTTATQVAAISDVKLTGTINSQSNTGSIVFEVPGSEYPEQDIDHKIIPMYDRPLGVISLLKTPNIEVENYEPLIYDNSIPSEENYYHFNHNPIILIQKYTIKDNLELVINPSSELVLEDATASVVLEYIKLSDSLRKPHQNRLRNDKLSFLPYIPGATIGYTNQGGFNVPFQSYHGPDWLKTRNSWINLELAEWEFHYKIGYGQMPISAIKDLSFYLWNHNDLEIKPKILIRVNATLYNPVSKERNVIVQSYLVDPIKINTNPGIQGYFHLSHTDDQDGEQFGSEGQPLNQLRLLPSVTDVNGGANLYNSNWRNKPDYLYFNNENLGSGNYGAWQGIIFGENVQIASGATFRAGEFIKINPDNVINPDVSMKIGFSHNSWYKPATDYLITDENYIHEFCTLRQPGNYKPEAPPKSKTILDNDTTPIVKTFDFKLYPNPTSRIVNVELPEMAEGGVYDITVMDIRGQVMSEMRILPSETIGSVYEMEVSHLTAGIYFVRLVIDGEAKVKRLVIL